MSKDDTQTLCVPKIGYERFVAVLDGVKYDEDVVDQLRVFDPDAELNEVAAMIGRWALIVGASFKAFRKAEATYRHERSKLVVEYLAKDPKMAEWKVMAGVRGDKRYIGASDDVSRSEGVMESAKRIYDAFQAKSRALQTRSANERAELGPTTSTSPRGAYAQDGDDRQDRMRETTRAKD